MRNLNRCLLCCDSKRDLFKLKNTGIYNYVVATNNYQFYKNIREKEKVSIFLESDETSPYKETWEILDQINSIIDSSGKYEYAGLYRFPYIIESGFPSKIAQMIINLNLIHKIVKKFGVNEIYLYDNKDNWIINESLYFYARSRNMSCHILDGESKIEKSNLKTLETLNLSTESFEYSRLGQEEKKKLNYYLSKKTKKYTKTINKYGIGVLYCCPQPYNKHVEWTTKRIKAIADDVKVICYYDNDDIKKFENKGFETYCLEDFFSKDSFVKKYNVLNSERRKILKAIKKMLNISYLNVDLSDYLYIKIRNFYYRELIDRFYIDICAEKYFEFNQFDFINIWENTCFWETLVCSRNTKKNNTKLFSIVRTNFILFEVKQPYQNLLSAVFLTNNQAFLDNGYTNDFRGKICYINDVIFNTTNNMILNYESMYVGVFPAGILGSFTTCYFYYNTLLALLRNLLKKNMKIIFKNHPGMKDCWERDVRHEFINNESFLYYDGYEPIKKVIEQCKLVITDISSVALDAAIEGRVVFCIVDEQGYKLISHHKNGFLIYKNVNKMIQDIELVLSHRELFQKIIERQNIYLNKLLNENDINTRINIRNILYDL